jgi:hypothetical protein
MTKAVTTVQCLNFCVLLFVDSLQLGTVYRFIHFTADCLQLDMYTVLTILKIKYSYSSVFIVDSQQPSEYLPSCRQYILFGMTGMCKDSLQPALLAILSLVLYVDSLMDSLHPTFFA